MRTEIFTIGAIILVLGLLIVVNYQYPVSAVESMFGGWAMLSEVHQERVAYLYMGYMIVVIGIIIMIPGIILKTESGETKKEDESTFKYKDEEIQPETYYEKVQPKTDLKKSPTQGTFIAIIAGIIAVIVIIGYVSESPPQTTQQKTTESIPSAQTQQPNCSGEAGCYVGKVTGIVDGDTILVDGQSVRLALASTPELNTAMGKAAKQYVLELCPLGSRVTVDEDDGQTEGSYGGIVGLVYCNGVNVNKAVLDKGFGHLSFVNCDKSEFSDDSWAQKSGCSSYAATESYQP